MHYMIAAMQITFNASSKQLKFQPFCLRLVGGTKFGWNPNNLTYKSQIVDISEQSEINDIIRTYYFIYIYIYYIYYTYIKCI